MTIPDSLRPAADTLFGDRLVVAQRYTDLLAGPGTERGLIGPAEVDRLWDRHLLNCAVVGELIPQGATVIDVGSGAGLPGIVLAIARPDLQLTLVDSMARRTAFLELCRDSLELAGRVQVIRGRAEELDLRAAVVTARAVAPLGKLARWCSRLISPGGGQLLAIKGESAAEELARDQRKLPRIFETREVVLAGQGIVPEPTRVIRLVRR